MDSASENGTTRATDIGVMGVLQGEKKEKEQEEKNGINNSWKYPKFDEKH